MTCACACIEMSIKMHQLQEQLISLRKLLPCCMQGHI